MMHEGVPQDGYKSSEQKVVIGANSSALGSGEVEITIDIEYNKDGSISSAHADVDIIDSFEMIGWEANKNSNTVCIDGDYININAEGSVYMTVPLGKLWFNVKIISFPYRVTSSYNYKTGEASMSFWEIQKDQPPVEHKAHYIR